MASKENAAFLQRVGGFAFPAKYVSRVDQDGVRDFDYAPGMTLLDYFAAQAMFGILSDPNTSVNDDEDEARLGEVSYRYAASMMAARQKAQG